MNHWPLTVVWHRPKTTVLLFLLLLAGTGSGFYLYALHQWRTFQATVKDGQLVEARNAMKICLWMWPRSPSVHLLAARTERMSGHFAEAETHLNLCLKLQPEATADVELEFLLMRVQRGEVDVVAPALLRCVEEHHPDAPLILETLASAYLCNLRYGPAFSCLERWIEEWPDMAQPYHLRGWMFERLADRQGALRDYKRALELEPDMASARLHLAELYLQMANANEALPHLQQLHRQFPDRADIAARLGHCRFLLGETEEARRLLESAREKLPDDMSLLIQLARIENLQGDPKKAEALLRHALEVDPVDPEAHYALSNSLRIQGRLEEAEAAQEAQRKSRDQLKRVNHLLEEAARHPLSDPNALFEIGSFLLHGGQARLGLYWLHQVLQQDEGHRAAHRVLADYYDKHGDPKQAETHRRWLHEAKPDKDK